MINLLGMVCKTCTRANQEETCEAVARTGWEVFNELYEMFTLVDVQWEYY